MTTNAHISMWLEKELRSAIADFDSDLREVEGSNLKHRHTAFSGKRIKDAIYAATEVYRRLNKTAWRRVEEHGESEEDVLAVVDAMHPVLSHMRKKIRAIALIAGGESSFETALQAEVSSMLDELQKETDASAGLARLSLEQRPSALAELASSAVDRRTHTGLPGRPTSRHIVTLIFNERKAAGQTDPSVSGEAKAIEEAFIRHEKTEGLAPPTKGTIENLIRPLHRQWKQGH